MKHPEEKEITITKLEEEKLIEYKGNEVVCDATEINSDGTVYLSGCKVDNKDVAYTYGKEEKTQVFKPQYYSWDLTGIVEVTNALAEADRLTTPPTGKDFYLGYDVSNGKVSAAYVCFIRNETEYCLKGYDIEEYDRNVEILNDAYADVENVCSLEGGHYSCSDGGLSAYAYSYGYVGAYADDASCSVAGNGTFGCYE